MNLIERRKPHTQSASPHVVLRLPPDVLFPHSMTIRNSMSNYVYERRARIVRTVGVVGGLYLVGRYASARMADMSDHILQKRAAREKYV
jgi:hypothetical protein